MARDPAPFGPYTAYTGFVSIPRYFDYSPQEFLRIAPKGVGVIQRVLHMPGYTYELEERANSFGLLEEAAECLSQAHCQVIGQTGTNWVHCKGNKPDEIREICAGISQRCGATFLMMGLSIVDALQEMGAKRITVANGYYQNDWAAGFNRFLGEAGFEILWSGNMVDQGIYDSQAELMDYAEEIGWAFPATDVVRAIHKAHLAAPEADAVVQAGFGFRTVSHVESIEAIIDKPLIASDISLYWDMLKHLNLGVRINGFGRLMATLS